MDLDVIWQVHLYGPMIGYIVLDGDPDLQAR